MCASRDLFFCQESVRGYNSDFSQPLLSSLNMDCGNSNDPTVEIIERLSEGHKNICIDMKSRPGSHWQPNFTHFEYSKTQL